MAERKEFFEVGLDFIQLEEHARSSDSNLRWASAIELGQLGTIEAISLLWSLTTDSDENVRDAANFGLQNCDQVLVGKVLATKWQAPVEVKSELTSGISKYVHWKVRPLEIPAPENEWAVDAAVLNIIQTEGPMTGSRLLRLYGNAAFPNDPRKLPKSRIQTAVKRLERRGLVTKLLTEGNDELEFWTLLGSGKPEIDVREQGQRKLSEIPVTEVIARLQINMGEEFEYASQNDRMKVLMTLYGIKQSELHILGDILAKEWSLLLQI